MNLRFWRKPAGAWLRPARWSRYRRPPQAYGMTTDAELALLEAYARDEFTGAGRIVDLGCWFGATTLSLARGLAANSRAASNRTIEAFDLFRWEAWMNPSAERASLPRRYEVGESFHDDVKALLAPYEGL